MRFCLAAAALLSGPPPISLEVPPLVVEAVVTLEDDPAAVPGRPGRYRIEVAPVSGPGRSAIIETDGGTVVRDLDRRYGRVTNLRRHMVVRLRRRGPRALEVLVVGRRGWADPP